MTDRTAMATIANVDLWELVLGHPQLDPDDLAAAIERQAAAPALDFRTRLLIRDGIAALRSHWGPQRTQRWLAASPAAQRLRQIEAEDLGAAGFGLLPGRLMQSTRRDTVLQFLRELGLSVEGPLRLTIGGSVALILADALTRRTEDIDVVDEVPGDIRGRVALLEALSQRYGLRLAHFQSHYLPDGWESRVNSLGTFGGLQVMLVDVYDIFVGKLFSPREKDRDDLRAVAPRLDRELVARRLRAGAGRWLADAALRGHAQANWYIVFGESLPQ